MKRILALTFVSATLIACGGGGGGGGGAPAGGGGSGGTVTQPPTVPVVTTHKASGEIVFATNSVGSYLGLTDADDPAGVTERLHAEYFLHKNQVVYAGLSWNNDSQKGEGFESLIVDLAPNEFVEFSGKAIGPDTSYSVSVTVRDSVTNGVIEQGNCSNNNPCPYRFTNTTASQRRYLMQAGGTGRGAAIVISHSVPTAGFASAGGVSAKDDKPSQSIAETNQISYGATVRKDGRYQTVYFAGADALVPNGADSVAVPQAVWNESFSLYGHPIESQDQSWLLVVDHLIEWLKDNSEYADAWPDGGAEFHALGVNDPQADQQTHYLGRAAHDFKNAWLNTTGQGVTVCVIDSGIDKSHDELTGRLVGEFDVRDNDGDASAASPSTTHGTTTTTTLLANGNNNVGIVGGAYEANLFMVRNAGSGLSTADIYNGLEYCVDNAVVNNIKIISISQASAGQTPLGTGLLPTGFEAKLESFLRNGGFIVQSIGNSNRSRSFNEVTRVPGYLLVGATDTDGTTRASYSDYGAVVDLSMFGGDFAGTGKGVRVGVNGNEYATVAGTSYSAPLASALLALMVEAYPAMHPREFHRAAHEGLISLGDTNRIEGQGTVNVNANRAVDAAIQMRNAPYQLLLDEYRMRHSGSDDLVFTVYLDDASANIAQVSVATSGEAFSVVGTENVQANSFDVRLRPLAVFNKGYEESPIAITFGGETLNATVVAANTVALNNVAASYRGITHLIGINKSGQQFAIKSFDVGDLHATDGTKFTFLDVEYPETYVSLRVGVDLDRDGVFCETNEFCSQAISVNGDVTGLAFRLD